METHSNNIKLAQAKDSLNTAKKDAQELQNYKNLTLQKLDTDKTVQLLSKLIIIAETKIGDKLSAVELLLELGRDFTKDFITELARLTKIANDRVVEIYEACKDVTFTNFIKSTRDCFSNHSRVNESLIGQLKALRSSFINFSSFLKDFAQQIDFETLNKKIDYSLNNFDKLSAQQLSKQINGIKETMDAYVSFYRYQERRSIIAKCKGKYKECIDYLNNLSPAAYKRELVRVVANLEQEVKQKKSTRHGNTAHKRLSRNLI